MEDITLSLSALAAFATIVGGYATMRANVNRLVERVTANEQADSALESRVTKLERWKAYLAGRDGADDPTQTKEFRR